jgi:hypothetical protein
VSGQPANGDPSISSVDAGIVIEFSLHPEKAYSPISFTFETSSNVIAVIL